MIIETLQTLQTLLITALHGWGVASADGTIEVADAQQAQFSAQADPVIH